IDSVFLSLASHCILKDVAINGKTIDNWKLDSAYEVIKILLSEPLLADSSISIEMNMRKDFEGFSQGDPQASLVFVGSFASIDEYLPVMGFDESKRLNENRLRLAYDLPRLSSLLAETADQQALLTDAFRSDAIASPAKMTIGSSADQTPVGSGRKVKSWEENGRSYMSFILDSAESINWYVGSAPYNILGKDSQTEVYHLAKHPFNAKLYQSIMYKAKQFLVQHLGSFPYASVRLYEIPFYQEEVYAFSQGIAISEKAGWIADTSGLKEKAYLHFTIGQAMAQQWIQHHLKISDVQGADMIKIAMPGALALQFVKTSLGEKAVKELEEQMLKIYNKERHNDPIGEPPLLYADGKDYLEQNLGSLALYEWSEELGLDSFAATIQRLPSASAWIHFPSIYQHLLTQAPTQDRKDYWKNRFETVTK
ncbi:MAG: hypothetical protein AAF696_29085, partial [Bacteroidota bacterium]